MRDYRAIVKCKDTHTIFNSLSDPLLKSHYTFTSVTYRNNITNFVNGSYGILMKFQKEAKKFVSLNEVRLFIKLSLTPIIDLTNLQLHLPSMCLTVMNVIVIDFAIFTISVSLQVRFGTNSSHKLNSIFLGTYKM